MSLVTRHLLLALTLVLNGVTAPWAMARMNHGTHDHGSHAAQASADATGAVSPHAHHHGGDHSTAQAPAPTDSGTDPGNDTPHGSSCCDGLTCLCGCVIPPAVHLAAPLSASPTLPTAPRLTVKRFAVVYHGSPPFRPPTL